tara:strand:- start:134 stop:1597 length:1464 start_codon:yes stop_codon:yes gene_type:complete
MLKALMVMSERFPIGVATTYKPGSIFSPFNRSLINFISKLLFILLSLKNNIIIFIFFISLILFGCETTQLQTNTLKTPQTVENILKNNKTEIKKTIEEAVPDTDTDTGTDTGTEHITDIKNKTIKVGIMLPLTGKHYQIGNSLLSASQLALDKTQNKNIKFFIRDTGNEDNITKNFYSLLNENVDIILGPIFSKSIFKIQPLAKDENIQIITFSNNTKVAQNNLYIFGLTLEDEVQSILEYSIRSENKKLAAILPDNEYGKRIKNEITKFHNHNSSQLVKIIMYNPNNPDFYEISKNISEYEQRKTNLGLKIKELEALNTDSSNKQIKRLKNLDTFGDLPFDSLFIGVESFKQLSMISSILPYYDVDPKKIQYLGNSVWNKDSIIKEPGLNNSLFTSIDRESTANFKQEYLAIFNQKPHPIASLAYDAVGMVISLNENKKPINVSSLTSKQGFRGINGTFRLYSNGNIERNPSIYRVKNEKIYKVNN